MIEKLYWIESEAQTAYIVNEKALEHKINELVDAVNEIMTWRFETDDENPENRKCAENAHGPIDDEVREEIRRVSRCVNTTPAERYKNTIDSGFQDQFAEQRKWIGHLVEHNTPDNDSGNGYGILTAIYPGKVYPFEINGGEYYAHSVRLPRADILYGIG